jgi:hypothetical protein
VARDALRASMPASRRRRGDWEEKGGVSSGSFRRSPSASACRSWPSRRDKALWPS